MQFAQKSGKKNFVTLHKNRLKKLVIFVQFAQSGALWKSARQAKYWFPTGCLVKKDQKEKMNSTQRTWNFFKEGALFQEKFFQKIKNRLGLHNSSTKSFYHF